MAKKTKTPAPVDTTAGTQAYALAVQYAAQVEPRLPAGMIATLAADLTTLGAPPAPAQPAAATTAAPATAATPPPTLEQATTAAASLVSAIHESLVGAKAKQAVRKAYGVSSRGPATEPRAVLAAAEKIVEQATADPSTALGLGILPADVTALQTAVAAIAAAETAAQGSAGTTTGTTGAQRRAAETSMHEATARIAGAGALAFAQNATVRALFDALKAKKKKA